MTAVYEILENWKVDPGSLHPNWPNDRRINWNLDVTAHTDHITQNAVRIIDGGYIGELRFGANLPLYRPRPWLPTNVDHIEVYTQAIREYVLPSPDWNNDDELDPQGIRSVIAHEVGHSVDIIHYDPPDPNHPVDTIMIRVFARNLIPTQYNDYDRNQMRLR